MSIKYERERLTYVKETLYYVNLLTSKAANQGTEEVNLVSDHAQK